MKGTIIFGFPCIGKSSLCINNTNKKYFDLESSCFHWIISDEQKSLSIEERKGLDKAVNPNWPENYVKAIMEARLKYDYIFVSYEGKLQCQKYNIPYISVFPDYGLKDEYMERMKKRGNPQKFIDKISNNFDSFVRECYEDEYAAKKIILKSNQYLSDVIDEL